MDPCTIFSKKMSFGTDYYDELARDAQEALRELDMSRTCVEFNRFIRSLKTRDEDKYTQITSWFHALVLIHSIKSGDESCLFPYSPNHVETAPDCHVITYTLTSLPSKTLRGVLVGFMSHCMK